MSIQSVGKTGAPTAAGSTDPKARFKKACDDFEAIWVGQFLKEARPKSGTPGSSFASETFHDMLDQTLAQGIAAQGVFGLSKTLAQQFAGKPEAKP